MPKKASRFLFRRLQFVPRDRRTSTQHLKWLSLRDLGNLLIPSRDEELSSVVHFSAYLTHRPHKLVRHRAYVAALEVTGVECVLGRLSIAK